MPGSVLIELQYRRSVPQDIPQSAAANLQEALPCLRTHLLSPLPSSGTLGTRAALEHQFQALRPLHQRTQPGQRKGLLGPLGRLGRQHAAQ